MRYFSELPSPIGLLTIVADERAVTHVLMRPAAEAVPGATGWKEADARLADARAQLDAYFAGELRRFTLPLAPRGSPFQLKVWSELEKIPFGTTTSYGAIAAKLGMPGSARAVGAANRSNPIAIVVPCHRVIGADGTLTGYGGGLERKKFLLALETRIAGTHRQMELGLVR